MDDSFFSHPSICDLVPPKKIHKSIHVTAIDKKYYERMDGRFRRTFILSSGYCCAYYFRKQAIGNHVTLYIYLFIYLLVLLSWLISVLTYLHGFLCFVLLLLEFFFKYESRPDTAGAQATFRE